MDYTGKTLYIMSGTHWDREWYQPFQGFRYRLVNTLDFVIDYLEQHPEFPVFTLDGQTIVLEDYLEIRPETRERLQALIQQGRILIGPWYCMPDELILSGESLIANLQRGHRIAQNFGVEAWKFGYVCDIFGHAAQTPQIFNGFGIPYALLGRGTQRKDCPYHFRWQALDGSECLVQRLDGRGSYSAVAAFLSPRIARAKSEEEKDQIAKEEVDRQFSLSGLPVAYLTDAADHQSLHPVLLEHKERIERVCPGIKVIIGDIREMMKNVEPYQNELKVFTGELNRSQRAYEEDCETITNTLSSRYDLKLDNDRCQTLMEKWVGPLTLASSLAGRPLIDTYTDLAYQYLLQNHPHDSICGCSIAQVHQDMKYRFDQCRQIAGELVGDVLFHHRMQTKGDSWNFILNLYNPLPYERDEVVTVDLVFPSDYPYRYQERFGYDDVIHCFELYDQNGKRVPYTLHRVQRGIQQRVFGPHMDQGTSHLIQMRVPLSSGGVTQLIARPSDHPTRQFGSMITSPTSAENEHIALEIQPDGTLRILHKASGKVYERIGSYLDDAEIGDGWYHCHTADNRVVSSIGSPCTIEVESDGPAQAVFRVTNEMRVPRRIERSTYHVHHMHRSEDWVSMPVTTRVILDKGSDVLRIRTTVQNTARDHRLRLLAETGITGEQYFASEAFGFVDRPCGIDPLSYNWVECDSPEKALAGIIGKRGNDGAGFAIVCAGGLHEGGSTSDGRLTVTLLRSFSTTRNTNGEEEGQLIGELNYEYAFVPMNANDPLGRLQRIQDCMTTGVKSSFVRASEEDVPKNRSLYRLTGDASLCMSTAKLPLDKEANTAIVRLYNPSEYAASGVLQFERQVASAFSCDMLEQPIEELEATGQEIALTLPPWKIVTVRINLT